MHALRRYKLRALIDTRFHGDRGAFLTASGLSKGRLSQLLDPDQAFGDKAARNLEDRLHMPAGYFDSLDERTQHFAMTFESLSDDLKSRWEELANLLLKT